MKVPPFEDELGREGLPDKGGLEEWGDDILGSVDRDELNLSGSSNETEGGDSEKDEDSCSVHASVNGISFSGGRYCEADATRQFVSFGKQWGLEPYC